MKYDNIFTSTRPIAIKSGKVVTYYRGLLPIKSPNPLNKWPFEII